MPTNRTRIARRQNRRQITPEVIAAWEAADYHALHAALGLDPWDASPLPEEITALGVPDDDEVNAYRASVRGENGHWAQSLKPAVMLQRQLLKIAGWPDCRKAYEENLEEAERTAAYCRELVEHPERGGQGTGSDPESRRRRLQQADDEVAWRKQLLKELDGCRKQWRPKSGNAARG